MFFRSPQTRHGGHPRSKSSGSHLLRIRVLIALLLAVGTTACIQDPASNPGVTLDAQVDAAVPDGDIVDASHPDAASSDAAVVDAGPVDAAALDDECVPFDDQCPSRLYCQYSDGALRCVPPHGPAYTPDAPEPCPAGRCQRGAICMALGASDEARCYQPCDPDAESRACTNSRHTCWTATDDDAELSFGVCQY